MKARRYLLFSGSIDYREGGWYDFVGSYDSVEEALTTLHKTVPLGLRGWWHIVDTETQETVKESSL